MSSRAWDEGIETGVESVDVEHRLQVKLIDALEELLRSGSDPALASRTMAQLVEFTAVHFLSEELMMAVHRYPHESAHKAEHARLSQEVAIIRERMESGRPADALEPIGALHRWLSSHIKTMDQAFARWCAANTVAVR